MRKKIINTLIIGLIIILIPLSIKAQLFEENELYPNVSVIKGKYYSGTGIGRYWSLAYLDSIGRVIKEESYHEKKLMSRRKLIYDSNNNKIFDIKTFDYNNSDRIDTNRYEYKYKGSRIIYQFRKILDNDSTVIELIENQGDTQLKYQQKTFYYRPKIKKYDVYETTYTLRFKNGLLVSNEAFDMDESSRVIENYEYFENGKLKRRIIERIPEPKFKRTYVGGPGSDDEFYKYKLDSKGRIVKFYKIINGKKYKNAVYNYK